MLPLLLYFGVLAFDIHYSVAVCSAAYAVFEGVRP